MIRTSGGPLPTSRYPTVPRAVAATCPGVEVTEAVVAVGCDEPQAASAAVSAAAVSPAAIRGPRTAPASARPAARRFIAIPALGVLCAPQCWSRPSVGATVRPPVSLVRLARAKQFKGSNSLFRTDRGDSGRSRLQVPQDGQHPAVIGIRRRKPELAEDVRDVLLDGPLGDHQDDGDGAVGAALRHQREHLALAVGEAAE